MLAKQPLHTGIAMVTMALGIGLATAMFTIVYGTFLRGLPFAGADRIVRVDRNDLAAGIEHMRVGSRDFLAWREHQTSFEGLAAWYGVSANVSGGESPAAPFNYGYVTSNTFDLLQVQAVLGRTFTPEDAAPSAPPVVLLSDALWRERYGGRRDVLGETLKVDGVEKTIVGVMPPGFRFPLNQFLWSPLALGAGTRPPAIDSFEVFGKLKTGVSRAQALADLRAISSRLARELPEAQKGIGVGLTPYVEGYVDPRLRSSHYFMLGAVFVVLLIACANVGNMLLGRGLERSRELAVRMALGAGRRRVAAQLAMESTLLALAGGGLGLWLSRLGIALYRATLGAEIPSFWVDLRLDLKVFLFCFGTTALASLLAGVAPALQGLRTTPHEVLKERSGGSGGPRLGALGTGLVVLEIALSCGLLVNTALLVKSVAKLKGVDLGFAAAEVITAQISLYGKRYAGETSRLAYLDALEARMRRSPGVRGVAFASSLPAVMMQTGHFDLHGATDAANASNASDAASANRPETRWVAVSPEYFEIFGLRLLEGRGLAASDRAGRERVVLVNRSFARRFFGSTSPVGRSLRFGLSQPDRQWRTIVGVVEDQTLGGIDTASPQQAIYLPLAQEPRSWLSLALKTQGTPADLAARLQAAGAALDPDTPIFAIQSMAQDIADVTRSYTRPGVLFTLFGALAFGLAALGLYGVIAFSVGRRTQEIAIRVALGATSGDVRRLVLKTGLFQLVAGLSLGLLFAIWLARLLRAVLFQVRPSDPAVFVGVIALLLATGGLACLLPSRRALRNELTRALRPD